MPYGHIYAITHLPTGRYYIGQTRSRRPSDRWSHHVYDAGRRASSRIGNAIAKYGKDAFVFEVLACAESQQELDSLERLWILITNSRERSVGWNIREGGNAGGPISEESRSKMSAAQKARYSAMPSDYWIKRNREIADKTRGKKKRPYTEQARKNFSAGQKRRYLNNPGEIAQMAIRNKVAGKISWASLTPEQKERRLAPMKAARWKRDAD